MYPYNCSDHNVWVASLRDAQWWWSWSRVTANELTIGSMSVQHKNQKFYMRGWLTMGVPHDPAKFNWPILCSLFHSYRMNTALLLLIGASVALAAFEVSIIPYNMHIMKVSCIGPLVCHSMLLFRSLVNGMLCVIASWAYPSTIQWDLRSWRLFTCN